ncbi:MAG: hypothetical protein M1838_002235 [Thelocarpon superellum]|nr:MAG: hypothetical protein M1838_002235 [Thelocarpon superellum]
MPYPGAPVKRDDATAALNFNFNVTPPQESEVSLDEKTAGPDPTRSRASSHSSSSLSLKTPRTPRFAEATTVHSPVEAGRSPFADPPHRMENHYAPHAQPSDVGFGYIGENENARAANHPSVPLDDAPKSPLRSALKVPGTPGRRNPLSPTFHEEEMLEKQEVSTDKENARDLKIKVRVRLAKIVLRCTNFSCSLIVLSMLSTTFSIFNATKAIPARNNLPAWASGTQTWPQIVLLSISCVSLLLCVIIMWNHWKGKKKRAAKTAAYYTVFSIAFFIFNIIMWAIGAGLINNARQNGNGQDLWGWSCKDNERKQLFQNDVSYGLVCRLQNWSLVCAIIEIVVELITILIYSVVFYRFYSKRRLRKSMDTRDKARTDLYLAQLRTQSAPNTPGFGPTSPRFASEVKNDLSAAEEGLAEGAQYASKRESMVMTKPFQLQRPPPPIKVQHASPTTPTGGFEPPASPGPLASPRKIAPSAPGEKTYDTVPIPGAYASPMASPSFTPARMSFPKPGSGQ